MTQPDESLHASLKLEARFAVIEHLLCNIAASILVSSRKTTVEVEAVSRQTSEAIRIQGLSGFHPVISDVVTTEIEDAVSTLYNLVARHMSALSNGSHQNVSGHAKGVQ